MRFTQMVPAVIMAAAIAAPAARMQAGQAANQAAGQSTAQPTNQPRPKSQAEVASLQKVQQAYNAQNWDGVIQAIDSTLENFPDTEFKDQLLDMAAQAAANKGDYAETVAYAERAVAANPQDVSMWVLIAEDVAQHSRDTDLDLNQSVKKVQDDANKALELLKNPSTPPPPGLPADQWPEVRKQLTEQAYDALAQAADLQKKFPESIADFKTALSIEPNPVTMARLAKAYVDARQYDDAISEADQVIAMNNIPPQVKQFAQAQKDAATKAKNAAPKSAAPAPPPPPK
jgi:tetratricopeptide (TPR) repeat protein